jgi:hypothetical protein
MNRSQKDGLQNLCQPCRRSSRRSSDANLAQRRKRPELIPDGEVYLKSFVAGYDEFMLKNYGEQRKRKRKLSPEESHRERVKRCEEIFDRLLDRG